MTKRHSSIEMGTHTHPPALCEEEGLIRITTADDDNNNNNSTPPSATNVRRVRDAHMHDINAGADHVIRNLSQPAYRTRQLRPSQPARTHHSGLL